MSAKIRDFDAELADLNVKADRENIVLAFVFGVFFTNMFWFAFAKLLINLTL